MGGTAIGVYGTIGQSDLVAVWQAPDDETAAKLALGTAQPGNVTTKMLRAFSEDELGTLVAALP